ncbi:flagellar hook-associated protein FlgK [Methylomonas sp. EFPC1]|uniref:Flagellar hook-associated protein 1 n=1 Tax=Methylomonas defluvii TaxID=3045149 RepID=A0ABU4ULB6_9GAMM|nr:MULTISPECIES: flagellar hook-associated protein FlgK [unclassified Methylomonas]MDX8130203.1 flagellar hook-associated protein FlgK [Methylomonas sp. OY6]PKD40523.1 flagellar hook-associated protein FlgK [Methylomonas sp. Kb3]QBC29008.1 flagellar hook-associated protein FlgK [Methylomonas sp. LW13]QSB00596.1 flagellar hook-associated protein FlgK [Methylomonas sp. EFPC1]
MAIGILGNALSGLTAFQRSLETTSNNISNANTEGYSRQRVELATRPEQFTGNGYMGNGVEVANITRSYDQFISNQVRSSTATFHDIDSFYTLSSQIDNITADETTGLAPAMKSFFDAIDSVANDPSSVAARQVMLTEAESLTQQFNTMSARFGDLRKRVNDNITSSVQELNGFAKTLAELNVKIVSDIGRSSGKQMPNELMDQRDLLLTKIAEKADVSYVAQADGSYNVFIGKGQPLVLGSAASTLSVVGDSNDVNQKLIMLNGQDISKQLSGGEISGNLRFRDQVLDPAQQQLGLLATGLATEFNNIHKAGYDINGNTNVAFFDLNSPTPQVKATVSDSTLVVSSAFVAPTSASGLGAAYRLDVTATVPAATFSLTNLSDNTTTTGLSAATLATTAATNGFSISFSGGSLTSGDSFQISPNFNAAAKIKVNAAITNPRQIAAASATGLPGDNSNALKLANLETQAKMFGGKASFTQVYGQMISDVGSQTHAASVGRTAQETLLKQATSAKENVSGVNLDEEAANLINFQNSYQAAAKAVSVANSLFDTLIGAFR